MYPDFICPESDAEFSELAEIDILHCRNTAGAELSHRDYLGALMSLGIERKTLGDILTHEDEAVIFLKKSITPYVLENLDKVFSPKEIYRKVWGDDPLGAENTVTVHIRHLREKIEINPREPRYLKVVWGLGYKVDWQS